MSDTQDFDAIAREIVVKYCGPVDNVIVTNTFSSSGMLDTISSALRLAVEAEREELLRHLGYDQNGLGLRSEGEHMGDPVTICHDPYYDLEGAIIDLERTNADAVCIATIRRHQAKICDLVNSIRSRSGAKDA